MARSPLVVTSFDVLRRPGDERELHGEVAAAECAIDDERIPDGASIDYQLRLETLTDGVVVTGRLGVPWEGECRRCLRPLAERAAVEVDELYQRVPTLPDAFPIGDDLLDLRPMIGQAAVLGIPTHPLCRAECRGLCPTCGVDRNETECSCSPPERDSPWAALDQLRAGLAADPESRQGR